MLRNIVLCCAVVFLVAACTSATESQGGKPPKARSDDSSEETPGQALACVGDVSIGKPVAHKNLAIFPLYLASHEEVKENYITLEEALDGKQVEVCEVGAAPGGNAPPATQEQRQVEQPAVQPSQQGFPQQQAQELVQQEAASAGTVNAVDIENKSKRPLYILAGQVIIGGKQDRVITQDTVIPPGQKVRVEVCCVEQGRWSPRQGNEMAMDFCDAANTVAQGSIKLAAQSKGREAQGEVWQEVAKAAKKLGAETSTGTYKQVVEKTQKTVDDYLVVLKRAFEKDSKACGFAVCINGRVESCDLFASPKLLAKFRVMLLRGYVLDALNAGEAKDAGKATVASIESFMKEMQEAQKNTEKLVENKHRRIDKLESKRIIGFSNCAPAASGEKALHYNAYSKKK